MFRVDTTMLAVFTDKTTVGEYGAAYRLLETTLFVGWSVGTAVYPVFSRLSPTSEPRVGFLFDRSLKLVVALTLPLAAGALVLADPLIQALYGADYDDAAKGVATARADDRPVPGRPIWRATSSSRRTGNGC